ncbi:MAG: anthranilate phosphoribosyltransferase [Planctomycetota bacterium]
MNAVLERVLNGIDLSEAESEELLVALTHPELPPPLAGALLAALRAKGEKTSEIRGFARGMRRLALRPQLPNGVPFVDIVGTGGDGSGSVNISTGAALLAAACGLRVVKHGNRSVSSQCGSADLLEGIGLPIPLDERRAATCLAEVGFTFLFAPYYHPAMKALAPVRRSLGVRTVFNMLGPLTNPAEPKLQLIGAFSQRAAFLIAETLAGLPIGRAFVVHGEPGWDEPTPIGPFLLLEVRPGQVSCSSRDPKEYGLERCRPEDLRGGDAATNTTLLRQVFAGARNPHRDALVLSVGLVLELADAARNLHVGIKMAEDAIDDGRAQALLTRLEVFGKNARTKNGSDND